MSKQDKKKSKDSPASSSPGSSEGSSEGSSDKAPPEIISLGGRSTGATRTLRIGMIALVIFGVSWRLANPNDIAADADLYATPWAMVALLPVFALGVWTYEVTGRGGDTKGDLVWGVLIALTAYLGLTVVLTFIGS